LAATTSASARFGVANFVPHALQFRLFVILQVHTCYYKDSLYNPQRAFKKIFFTFNPFLNLVLILLFELSEMLNFFDGRRFVRLEEAIEMIVLARL